MDRKKNKLKKDFLIVNENLLKEVIEYDSFKERIILGACLLVGLNENMEIINLEQCLQNKFSPSDDYTRRLFQILQHSNLISPYYPINNSFVSKLFKFNSEIVDEKLSSIEVIKNLLEGNKYFIDSFDNKYALWKEISIEECIEYYKYSMTELHFNYIPGEKFRICVEKLLENLSTAQIYAVMYRAINTALRFLRKEGIDEMYAANTIVPHCYSIYERVMLNNYELKPFDRPFKMEQSIFSKYFFDKILKIGNKGFLNCPNINLINEVL
jgi:hypothetical protein